MSLPSRERGLKSAMNNAMKEAANVAPLAGARIEIVDVLSSGNQNQVAPLAGARIEMYSFALLYM